MINNLRIDDDTKKNSADNNKIIIPDGAGQTGLLCAGIFFEWSF